MGQVGLERQNYLSKTLEYPISQVYTQLHPYSFNGVWNSPSPHSDGGGPHWGCCYHSRWDNGKDLGKTSSSELSLPLSLKCKAFFKKKKTFTSIIKTKGENTKWLRRSKRSFHFIKRCKQPSITGSFSERQQEQQKGIKCLESKTCGQLSSCLFHEPLCPHLSLFLICEIGITVQGFSKAQGDESAYEL